MHSLKAARFPDGGSGGSFAPFLWMLLALATGFGRNAAADADPQSIKHAHEMVKGEGNNKGNDKLVMGFAYPTAKKLIKLSHLRTEAAHDGSFELTYRYYYRNGDNEPADFQLRFRFDPKGKLTEIRQVEGKHSCLSPPFSTAEIAMAILKEAIRNDEKMRSNPLWKKVLDTDKATEALVLAFNIKGGK